ncbi:MAG: AsnC family transcriptional regulator [Sedimenticola sp.]
MLELAPLDRRIINRYQGGFPLVKEPFDKVAAEFDISATELIGRVDQMLARGWLTRFGPLYNAERLGGGLTLAALSVPEEQYRSVTNLVNMQPEVAHNYRRDHLLNMWFVIATETPEQLADTIAQIESNTGLKVCNFPKLREFYLGLWFEIGEQDEMNTRSIETAPQGALYSLDEYDRRIVVTTQEGLPLDSRPYADVARRVLLTEDEVIERMERLLDNGVIRRIGLVPNHYKLGFRGNGMSVWDIPDEKLDTLGQLVAGLDFVSHCYQRPRYEGVWPYNLFAMVHGRDRDEVRVKTEQISQLLGDECRGHDVLFSTEVLKKTGLRMVA